MMHKRNMVSSSYQSKTFILYIPKRRKRMEPEKKLLLTEDPNIIV
jgi:hypothetical protein